MNESQNTGWAVEQDESRWRPLDHINHPAHWNDADNHVKVWLRASDYDVQVQRLARLLNRVAPDGVLPDDEANDDA